MTITEIQAGIEVTREQDEAKASELEQWLAQVAETFNVIAMDAQTFREWARLMHGASDTLYEDAMIAATARVHKLTLVTRNVADSKQFKVQALNPFQTARKRFDRGAPRKRYKRLSSRRSKGSTAELSGLAAS